MYNIKKIECENYLKFFQNYKNSEEKKEHYVNIYNEDEDEESFIDKINKIKEKNNIRISITNITKDNNFISYLINRRLNKCIKGCSCNDTALHIAAFMIKFDNSIHSNNTIIGENSFRYLNGCNNKVSIHAEMDALNKLFIMKKMRRVKKTKMDLVVIRINRNGKLCESAPCYHCTQELLKNNLIVIDKLYYSTIYGNIVCIKFDDWIKYGLPHISKGWKYSLKNNEDKNYVNVASL